MITITALGKGSPPSSSKDIASTSTSPSPETALCYLIRIDNSYLLLDCGSSEDLSFPTDGKDSDGESTARKLADYTTSEGDLDTHSLSHLPLDEAIELIAPKISLVLLSHSTIRHVGLYAYARARLGLTCPAYASLPTGAMGRLTSLEASLTIASECDVQLVDKRPQNNASDSKKKKSTPSVAVKKEEEDGTDQIMSNTQSTTPVRNRCIPTKAEIDEAFENIRTLRYLQPTALEGQMSSLSLTAHSAGHTLGGTVWKIRSPTSGTLVLAIDWNHVKERHIDGSGVIEGAASATNRRGQEEAAGTKRAEMLVTSGAAIGKINSRRKDKDKKLLDLIHDTLTNTKSTLHLPLDATSRLLEVLLLLDQHWAYSYPYARFPLCLVSKTGKEVIERARTMREWMGQNLQGEDGGESSNKNSTNRKKNNALQAAGGQGHGPLEFRFLRIFTSLEALSSAIPSDSAKVVITIGPSLLYGPSLKYFQEQVCKDSKHVIVLTQRSEDNSLSSRLKSWWEEGQGSKWDSKSIGQDIQGNGRVIEDVVLRQRVPLQGAELETHLEEERVKKQKEEHHKAMMVRSRRRQLEADDDDEDSDSDSDSDADGESESDGDELEGMAVIEGMQARRDRKRRRRRGQGEGEGESGGVEQGNEPTLHQPEDFTLSHDIYLRGNASRMTNFFSNTGHKKGSKQDDTEEESRRRHGVGIRYRAFPIVEKRKRVDGYGEVIDTERWIYRGRREARQEEERLQKEQQAREEQQQSKRRRLGDEDEVVVKEEEAHDEFNNIPTKFVTEKVTLEVNCRIAYIDLEGLIDGRALSIVLPQLSPRRLVLVNTPTSDAVTKFMTSLSATVTKEIFSPKLYEQITIGAQVKAYNVKLGEGVLESIQMGNWEEWSLGWISGQVQHQESYTSNQVNAIVSLDKLLQSRQQLHSEEEENKAIYAPTLTSQSSTQPTYFVGDVRLSKLKSTLSSYYKIPSEFGGSGVLVCGNTALNSSTGGGQATSGNMASTAVTVQKLSGDRIVIEGNAGKMFARVREALYGMHARISSDS
ncbi:unnamed protein product [Sympodiomycopsis kandeliae]